MKKEFIHMKQIYIPLEDIHQFSQVIDALNKDLSVKSILVLMAENNFLSNSQLSPYLKQFDKTILGGIFPELIVKGARKPEGILLYPLAMDLNVQLFNLEDNVDSIFHQLELKQSNSLLPHSTVFCFVDALCSQKDNFTETLFNYFGINASYFGGGTGSLSFNPIPSIITKEGIHSNSAVIAWTNNKISIGAAHGWQPISEPIKITKATNNVIAELDWKPAFELYKKIVEKHSELKFDNDNFFEIAKSYPLGVAKIDAEMVVRDPFKAEKNCIHFFDSIQEGEYIKILHGDLSSLLNGVEVAKELARKQHLNAESLFCVDCISRALFMQDSYSEELNLIGDSENTYGVLSIGEIANNGESFLEIYNKTIAIGLW